MVYPDQRHTTPTRHNLPIPQTSFIGRERATADIRRLLEATRLLTLTGSGGSGKSRMALHVAQETLAQYPDGVWWIDLAPLTDPELLPQTVAGVLGLAEQPDRSFADLIHEHLRQRAALLILDNCEHMRRACSELLGTLFAAGRADEPHHAARVLATSREPLAVADEQVWSVPLLALPDPRSSLPISELEKIEAVWLFIERAQAVAPAFELNERNAEAVARICRRLDGLPLTIELAAARVNVLTPAQVAERLDNSVRLLTRGTPASDARHQTLRAALDWSFDLLSAYEQTLFTRLAVFVGSFDLEAVEGVAQGADDQHHSDAPHHLERNDLLDLLASLIEKSLLVAAEQGDEMRYRLLEPIRHYAAERLRAGGEEVSWRDRHAAYFLALAERAEPELRGPDQARWLDRLERDHDNARAALTWCAAEARTETGLRLAGALFRFWMMRGYLGEGQRWTSAFLTRSDATVAPEVHIRALNASAGLYLSQSNFSMARALFEQSRELGYRAEYEEGIEVALKGLGMTLWELGDNPAARAVLEEAVQLSRAAGHQDAIATALNGLALVHQYQSDVAQARAYYEEALSIHRCLGNLAHTATLLFNLGTLAGQAGDNVDARMRFQEALATHRQIGNRSGVADTLLNLGQQTAEMGDFAAAAAVFAEAEQIYRETSNWGDLGYVFAGHGDIAFYAKQYAQSRAHYHEALSLFRTAGNQRLMGRALGRLGQLAVREGNLAEAAVLCAEALTLRRALGNKAGMIFALEGGYVELAVAVSRPTVAARLLGTVEVARQAIARPRTPMEVRDVEPIMGQLQTQLGDETFTSSLNEGRAMNLEQAVAYALDILSPAAVAQPRPELRIFALGPMRVYRGDRLLTSGDWTYTKARELVLYLLCRTQATREQVGVELWPDATTEQVRQRFSAALAHARGALGREVDWIPLVGAHYRFNRERPYWFDVDVFEASLREAQWLLRTGTQDERATSLLDESVNLYGNDFAEDVADGEWHAARRAALRHGYLEALLALGRLHAKAGRDQQVIKVYQRAIAKDAYLEEAHHEVIHAYARLDQRRQAFEQYAALKVALAELNAIPSAETTALIERLRRGEPF